MIVMHVLNIQTLYLIFKALNSLIHENKQNRKNKRIDK